MRTATTEEIAALESLAAELERSYVLRRAVELERDRELRAVELELASAVSVATASVASRDGDLPVILPERAVVWDRPFVVNDAPRSSLGEPWFLGIPLGTGWQAPLEVVAR
jgi:hypothetical protein